MVGIRTIYDEIMADLRSKGFGGYVDQLHDYKNDCLTNTAIKTPTYPTPKTKNDEDAAAIPPGGVLPPSEVTR